MGQRNTETLLLQNYQVLFQNIKKDILLATELAEYGYDSKTIKQGEELLNNLLTTYDINKAETAEETTAYAVFSTAFENTRKIYLTDRKKAKIVFKDQADVLKNLQLSGLIPIRNAALIDNMRLFYDSLSKNTILLSALKNLKINADHVQQQINNVANVQTSYANYIKEKGESQQATLNKKKAFDEIGKWIREFYSVAKIALEDQPQLLESVSKLVRS